MEHGFRIALWMMFLVGCLQAQPIGWQSKISLDFKSLDEVKCGANMTFTSPTNVKDSCYTAALKYFIQGLKDAQKNCHDDGYINDVLESLMLKTANWQTNDTLEALDSTTIQTNSSNCKWENKESRKKFQDFVKDFEKLVELLNSISQ